MKIVCETCEAVYAIEDARVPARGARAQCPRCGHQQRVLPPGATAPEVPPAVAPLTAPSPVRREPPPPPVDVTRPAPPPPPPVAPVVPRPPPPAAAPAAPTPAAAAPAPAADRCRMCGTPLTDPFDKALGVCDSCRQRQANPSYSVPAAAPPPEPAPKPAAPAPAPASAAKAAPKGEPDFDAIFAEEAAKSAAAQEAPASDPVDMLSMLESSSAGASSAELSAQTTTPGPRSASGPSSGRFNTAAGPSSGRSNLPAGPSSGRFTAARPPPRRGRLLPMVLVGLLLLGGTAFLFRSRIEAVLHSQTREAAPTATAAIQAVVPRWRLAFVDLSGTAREYLDQGNARLAEDTSAAYAEAEESFQKALVLDPSSDDAVAGYVQAAALGRGAQMSNATYQEATQLIEAAEQRSKGKPRVLVAHANLLLTRADSREAVLQARGLAQQALAAARPEERPEALLALGLTYLDTSAQLATQNFDEALKATPPLKRAYYYRGLANESTGDYQKAIEDLKARLAQDPEQADAISAMARIYEEVGEIGQARAIYSKAHAQHPDDPRSAVMLAALSYQVEGKPKEAANSLRALLKDPGNAPQDAQAEGWVHLAAAERALGNLEAATAAAEQALKVPGAGRAAHLQLFLLGLQRGKPELAAPHLEYLGGKAFPPALEKLLEGRLLFAQGKGAEAQQAFDESSRLDPRRLDARIYSAVAAARAGKREEALRLVFQAMQEDPSRLGPRPVVTLYFLAPADTLDGAAGYILKLAGDSGDATAMIGEAFVRLHQHDLAGADKLLRQALDVNGNAMAFAYRALVALERGDKQTALSAANQAVEQGRQFAITHYALGLAYALDGQSEPAKRELRAARDTSPAFLAADFRLAELEAKDNTPESQESARSRLVRVVGLDPSYLPAKRALYALQRQR